MFFRFFNHKSPIILALSLILIEGLFFNGIATANIQSNRNYNKLRKKITVNSSRPDLKPLVANRTVATTNLQILPATINLVKQYEGFRSSAYIDTSGLPVIGYGQTRVNGRTVRMGQYITQAEADAALEQELYQIKRLVLSYVKVDLNPHQLGALTSLVYNAGARVVTNSTLIKKLNAGDYLGAAQEFPRWNKANSGGQLVVFPGLTKRRLDEKKLFLTPYSTTN